MFCSISGEQCQEPVITKNGLIFERALITKFLENNSTCPVTGDPLTLADLIPIKSDALRNTKPRQLANASIPGLLQNFQNEWDSLMVETYNLKKQLETLRMELSHALYQNDASCRVIARVTNERDAARRELEALRQQLGISSQRMDLDNVGLDEETKNKLTSKSQILSSERRVRAPSPTLATNEDIKEFKEVGSYPLHKSSSPGVLCVAIHPTKQNLLLTGGVDTTAIVFDRNLTKKLATLQGHSKNVTCTLFHPSSELLFTASEDATVRVWSPSEPQSAEDSHQVPYKTLHTISRHTAPITQISLHPTEEFLVTASADQTWALHDINTGATLLRVGGGADSAPLTAAMLHPDGLILATGSSDNLIRIWDLKTQKNVATFQGHKGPITDIKFSENGYYLATAAEDLQVKLWDLRGPKNINSLKLDDPVVRLDYDYSGKYLAAAVGREIRVYTGKNLDHVVTLNAHADTVTDVKFGSDAKFIASTSMDRSLKLWTK
uniref:Pre-mRNA-processing factor 19 n=1 Tax=Arcella intermedia TaxID=1963864 RepID=A0A6B2L2U6_9EUKA|eukprot:TRINITY_DN5147_c0_g1_i1.p1 TRINITY_DN5147_c0_g1~~TRINITY_DN5147_c0_g1_i1.p1  ORF type:complete len:495 (-),score=106.25 TRINITY_DN5147_c0_g1_i1:15-1499(-)